MKNVKEFKKGVNMVMMPVRFLSSYGVGRIVGGVTRSVLDATSVGKVAKVAIMIGGLGIAQIVNNQVDKIWVETADGIVELYSVVYENVVAESIAFEVKEVEETEEEA